VREETNLNMSRTDEVEAKLKEAIEGVGGSNLDAEHKEQLKVDLQKALSEWNKRDKDDDTPSEYLLNSLVPGLHTTLEKKLQSIYYDIMIPEPIRSQVEEVKKKYKPQIDNIEDQRKRHIAKRNHEVQELLKKRQNPEPKAETLKQVKSNIIDKMLSGMVDLIDADDQEEYLREIRMQWSARI